METKIPIHLANPFLGMEKALKFDHRINREKVKIEYMDHENITLLFDDGTTLLIPKPTDYNLRGKSIGDEIGILKNDDGLFVIDKEMDKTYIHLLEQGKAMQSFDGYLQTSDDYNLVASIDNITAYIPSSIIDINNVEDKAKYIDKTLPLELLSFKIKEKEYKRFMPIVALKDFGKNYITSIQQAFINEHKINDVITGTVKSIVDQGVSVSLSHNNIGFIHISNLSWGVVKHPSNIVSVGQEIQVIIINLEHNAKNGLKISLGYKQLKEKPFNLLDPSFKEGTITTGKIDTIFKYGLIVMMDCGAIGFIHKSELDWNTEKTINNFNEGERIRFKIISIDPIKERIFLSIKQLEVEPWEEIEKYIQIGSNVEGKVIKILSFGLHIEILNKINCLFHHTDMEHKWREARYNNTYAVGQTINFRVAYINKEERNIKLREIF